VAAGPPGSARRAQRASVHRKPGPPRWRGRALRSFLFFSHRGGENRHRVRQRRGIRGRSADRSAPGRFRDRRRCAPQRFQPGRKPRSSPLHFRPPRGVATGRPARRFSQALHPGPSARRPDFSGGSSRDARDEENPRLLRGRARMRRKRRQAARNRTTGYTPCSPRRPEPVCEAALRLYVAHGAGAAGNRYAAQRLGRRNKVADRKKHAFPLRVCRSRKKKEVPPSLRIILRRQAGRDAGAERTDSKEDAGRGRVSPAGGQRPPFSAAQRRKLRERSPRERPGAGASARRIFIWGGCIFCVADFGVQARGGKALRAHADLRADRERGGEGRQKGCSGAYGRRGGAARRLENGSFLGSLRPKRGCFRFARRRFRGRPFTAHVTAASRQQRISDCWAQTSSRLAIQRTGFQGD